MQQAQAVRRALYVLFARLFAGAPDAALYGRLCEGGLEHLASVQGIDLTSDLIAPDDPEACATELTAEYARIETKVSFRASDYRGATDDPVVAISGYLREHGLETSGEVDLPLDHLSFALGIMGELSTQAEEGDAEAEVRARAFFLRHVQPWASQVLSEISAHADRHFYRGLSAMLSAFLGSERRHYRSASA